MFLNNINDINPIKCAHFGSTVTSYVGCVVFQHNESGQLINTELIHLIMGPSVWLGYPSRHMLINIPLSTTCHVSIICLDSIVF